MLDIERRSDVLVVRLNHGKVNAFDVELLHAITGAFRSAGEGQAIVLTAAGHAFSAGVDLRRIVDGGPAYVAEFLPALSETFLAVYDHSGPVVAAVNGHAIAGGCILTAACDLRLMSQGTIGLAELAVGVPFPTSALEIMRAACGPHAQKLVLGARLVGPDDARLIGLIDEVTAPEALLGEAMRWAGTLGQIPSEVYSFTKRQLHGPTRDRIAIHQEKQDDVALRLWSSDGVRQRLAEYLESLRKRPGAPS
jgi:enoyl-CoA hydratase